MQYADFTYYYGTYYGRTISSYEEFNSLEVRAGAYVNKITFGRAEKAADTENVKNAVCAVCDVLKKYEFREGIASENNDGYSITYENGSSNIQQRLLEAAILYLPAELLYRGVDR